MQLIFRADYEQTNSRDDSQSTATIPYVVLPAGDPNAEDETQVRAFLETPGTGIPIDYNELPLSEYTLLYVGGSIWTGAAKYSSVNPLVLGETVWEFDATGASVKFLQSKLTVSSVAVDATGAIATVPDFKGAIGVADENIEGCDVIVPQALLTARKRWLMTELPSPGYLQQCYAYVGSTNADTFAFNWLSATFSFDPGEMLLQAFTAVQLGLDQFECSYKFACSPNRTKAKNNAISIQGIPKQVEKNGFEYLWLYYRRGTSANVRVRLPQAVYVERVYDSNPFANLEIT